MIEYIKRHERDVLSALKDASTREGLFELLACHEQQIAWMQHERLAHLITMMFVCLFFLLSFGFALYAPTLPALLLTGVLLILSVAYIIHYYRLENGVQRLYGLSNQIRAKLSDGMKN